MEVHVPDGAGTARFDSSDVAELFASLPAAGARHGQG